VIYTRDGQYALINSRPDLPKFASNNRNQGTPDENKAVVQGSIAYFGTYSVNELTKTISLRINGSTYPNMIGAPDEQRVITSLTVEELRFTNPASSTGAKLEVVWRRAK